MIMTYLFPPARMVMVGNNYKATEKIKVVE